MIWYTGRLLPSDLVLQITILWMKSWNIASECDGTLIITLLQTEYKFGGTGSEGGGRWQSPQYPDFFKHKTPPTYFGAKEAENIEK